MAVFDQNDTNPPLLIMAAPNGARKSREDHPNLPITIDEVVAEARACHDAGAAMLHAHIRDDDGNHSLDAGRYRDLLDAMAAMVPGMPCQITTEKAGRFSPAEQAACLSGVHPDHASVSIVEITGDQSKEGIDFGSGVLKDAAASGTHLQYILYSPDDLTLLHRLYFDGYLPDAPVDVLFVLGRYSADFRSHPDDLDPFLGGDRGFIRHWMVCAFGPMEYDAMVKAHGLGGQARIGFENNLLLKDGTMASSSAELIRQMSAGRDVLTGAEASQLFRSGE